MRFAVADGQVLARSAVSGEPAGFALSPDGKRIAVATHEAELTMLDAGLGRLWHRELNETVPGLLFLRSGELLAGGPTKILRLDPVTGEIVGTIDRPGFGISIDADQTQLATSRWFVIGPSEEPRDTPFGVATVSLATGQKLRTFELPDQQLVEPSLSPDGRLLAVRAQSTHDCRHAVIVFDTTSGELVARRKTSGSTPYFVTNRQLALPFYGHTNGEPVELWTLPG